MNNAMLDELSMLSIKRSYVVADFRALEEGGAKIEGHAAVFGQTANIGGYFYEVIDRGAFDGCDFDDVMFFVNHDTRKIPLARSRRNNGNSTMQLHVDDIGLKVRANLDVENNQEAKALYGSIGRGDLDGMSFAFRIKEQRWENLDSDMPTRVITKFAKVFEVSAVNIPAYSNTDIYARDQSALENAKITLDNVRSQELENSKNLVEIERLRTQILINGGN